MAFWTPLSFFWDKMKIVITAVRDDFYKNFLIRNQNYHVKAKYENEFSTVTTNHFERSRKGKSIKLLTPWRQRMSATQPQSFKFYYYTFFIMISSKFMEVQKLSEIYT